MKSLKSLLEKINNNGKNIEISIPVDKIITDVDDYLYDNPIEIVYELSDPYYEKLDISLQQD